MLQGLGFRVWGLGLQYCTGRLQVVSEICGWCFWLWCGQVAFALHPDSWRRTWMKGPRKPRYGTEMLQYRWIRHCIVLHIAFTRSFGFCTVLHGKEGGCSEQRSSSLSAEKLKSPLSGERERWAVPRDPTF